jgi:transcriptional regulator with XRE-family HTH domain
MDSQSEWDFSIVGRSGLTQQEFARLAKVSRVTAIHWMQGRRVPSKHTAERAARVLKRLTEAVEQGTLPPSITKTRHLEPEQARLRMQEIVTALKR